MRSYSGRSVPEALEKVKKDLGEAALIIETRTVSEPGMFGRRVGYEIIAASDPEAERTTPRVMRAVAEFAAPAARPAARPIAGEQALDLELAAIRRQLARLATGATVPTAHLGDDLAGRLQGAELPAEMLAELDEAISRAGDRLEPAQRQDFAQLWLRRAVPCAGTIDWSKPRRLMVVGPTGVGKTTTIAKLAGELRLKRNQRVALATIDTYRVGATDQLRAYADLLDVPLEVAQTPAQLAAVLERFADYDHVLIDTAGRSPADAARVHELKGFSRCRPGIQVALAIAATAGRAEFAAVVERFSLLPLEHSVVTKLDECAAIGRLIGCLRRHRLNVNWFATGQEVPEDIQPADAAMLPARLFAANAVAA
ncbi:MAG TPA: flagellar biosynthesis protein FlhF [Planctomycetota bacterium]|nr:flagellar biosynthesis protein FlhF [Planctomycetota bacterium]